MMYSFTPFPIVDTVNDHTGFILMSISCAIVFWAAIIDRSVFLAVCSTLIFSASAIISFNTGTIEIPRNEPVIAELVNFDKVDYKTSCSSGKISSNCTKQKKIVTYKLPDNSVATFDAVEGVAYPQRAILYKKD